MKQNIFGHKQSPKYGGGGPGPYVSPYLLEILSTRPNAPVWVSPPVAATILANTGQTVSCSRSASAYCLGDDGLLHLLGANTVRVEPTGLLVEGASTNKVIYSNDLSNGNWSQEKIAAAQNATGPDGVSNSAWTVTATATTGIHRFYQHPVVATGDTATIYAKAGTVHFLGIFTAADNTNGGKFDLSNGTSADAGNVVTSIQALGGGWYRCVAYFSGAQASDFLCVSIADTLAHAGPEVSWTANGTETISVFGCQDEALPFATSYIPNATGSPVTRDADIVTVDNPLAGLGTGSPGDWLAGMSATPLGPWASFPHPGSETLLALYNGGFSDFFDFNGPASFRIIDAAGDALSYATTTPSGSDKFTFEGHTVLGAMSTTPASTGHSGTGTGVITTQPTTLTIGTPPWAATDWGLYGHMTDVYVNGQITVPSEPPSPSAVGGNAEATVTIAAPGTDGGDAIIQYRITTNPADVGPTYTGSPGAVVISPLNNGTGYDFTVAAQNALGWSDESNNSNTVTPAVPFVLPTNTVGTTDLTTWLNFYGMTAATGAMVGGEQSYDLSATTTNNNYIQHTVSGACVHFGIVAKQGTMRYLGLRRSIFAGFPNESAAFDLQTGSVSNVGSSITATQCVSLGGGYYYCEVSIASNSGAPFIVMGNSAADVTSGSSITGASGVAANVYHLACY